MNSNKKLIIISNEKISTDNGKIYCDNIDMKSIPEGLSKNFEVLTIFKKSKIKRFHQINIKKAKFANNIFTFLFSILKTLKYKEANYLLISITPHTFFAYLILFFFRKKIFVYLRSNGYEEYRAILGFIGPLIFHIMYTFTTFKSNIITCQKRLVKKKNYDIVYPSELDAKWVNNQTSPLLDKPRLLYSGRIKVEKGIFSLLEIFDKINNEVELSIVGNTKALRTINKKVSFLGFKDSTTDLIKIYDDHNITILPSFTEAHPKVVDESLSRARPVIIFEEINHIIQNKFGIFVSKRNANSLSEIIKFIMANYKDIQENMKKNKLPTKQEFISQMTQILN